MSGYDFSGAARDSQDNSPAAAAATDLGFGWGNAGAPSHAGGGGAPASLKDPGNAGFWSNALGGNTRMAAFGADNGGTSVRPPIEMFGTPRYAEGGAIPEEGEESPMMNSFGSQMQLDINAALKTVGDVFSYGRQLHGLGGGQQTAGNIPTKPFNETPKPQPMMPPSALPYGPGQVPFGKRTSQNEGEEGAINTQVAGNIPTKPFNETPKPQPMMPPSALPYGPGQVPFGKRVSENDSGSSDNDGDEGGAIPTDDEETA